MAEGFDPIIEAQACGTPVIVTDFSSMPELVRWGCCCSAAMAFCRRLTAWQARPDVDGICEALRSCTTNGTSINHWELRQRLWTADQIHQEYAGDAIVRERKGFRWR